MSLVQFIGLLMISSGIIMVGLGLAYGIPEYLASKNSPTSNKDTSMQSEKTKNLTETSLVVNLPAPESVVSSPLLVRGKVYGSYTAIFLEVLDVNGVILKTDTLYPENSETDETAAQLFQSSLVFKPDAGNPGSLHVRLTGQNDTILDEEMIPLLFRP